MPASLAPGGRERQSVDPRTSPLRSPPATPGMRNGSHPTTAPEHSPKSPGTRSFFVQKTAGRPGLTYEPVQKLGEGAFGVAHLVRDRRSGLLRVLKTINKRQSQVPPAQMEREIRNLKACDHPHIIRLFEYYEDYENIYLIMERAAGGELHQVLQEQRKKGLSLPERWVSLVTRQCLQAISYVHSMGIMHKDLKSENILLLHPSDVNDPHAQPHTVIIDLGIAELFAARLGRRARCTVVAGTPTHMAPEVWRGNFGPVADVWSLGVVLFELLSGELPFLCSSLNSAAEWLRLHRQGPNWALLNHISTQARALNQRMLSCDERMRPTAQQCLGHSWFKDDGHLEPAEVAAEAAAAAADAAGSLAEAPLSPAPASSMAAVSGVPPLGAVSDVGERLGSSLIDYQGRSKFEKVVLLQVASQLHTAQVGRVGEVFSVADPERNGHISAPELLTALRNLGVEPGDAESYVLCLDVDANGHVEYAEFAAGCIGLLCESLRGLLWQSFCILDVEGNGVLGRDEVHAVVTRAELHKHGFPGNGLSNVDEVIGRMDVDSHGQISFDELCRHFLPPRPPLPEPRTARHTEIRSTITASELGISAPGELPAEAMAGSASERGSQASPARPVATLRDEDFAQLLDEIEADHAESPKASGRPAFAGVEEDPLLDPRGEPVAANASDVCPPSLPGMSLLGVHPEATPVADADPEKTNLTMDEELSRMLADMANGNM